MDRELVRAGALLHDVAKTASILARKTGGAEAKEVHHDVLGGQMLRVRGLPDALARVVEQHTELDQAVFQADGALTEAELVCYADKRVTGTSVVPLLARKADLLVRYSSGAPKIHECFVLFEQLERKVNRHLVCGNTEQVLAPLAASHPAAPSEACERE